jgi:REP element-mobilizing transposase RayT
MIADIAIDLLKSNQRVFKIEIAFMEKQSEYQYDVLDMNIMLDHVHLLLDVNPRNAGGQGPEQSRYAGS